MPRGKRKKFRLKNITRLLCFCFPFGKKRTYPYQIESDSDDLKVQFGSGQTQSDDLETCADDTACTLDQDESSPGSEEYVQCGDEDYSPRQWIPKRKLMTNTVIPPDALLVIMTPGLWDSLPSWDQHMYQGEDIPCLIFTSPSSTCSTVSCMHGYPTSLLYYAICLWQLYLRWQDYAQIEPSENRDVCRGVSLSGRAVLRNFLMVASKLSHTKEASNVVMDNQYTIDVFVVSVPAHPALFKAIFGHLYYRKVGYSYEVPVVVIQNMVLATSRYGDMKFEYIGLPSYRGHRMQYSKLMNTSLIPSPGLQLMPYRDAIQTMARPIALPRRKLVFYNVIQTSRSGRLQITVAMPPHAINPQMGHFMPFRESVKMITALPTALPKWKHLMPYTAFLSLPIQLLQDIWTIPALVGLSASKQILASSATKNSLSDAINCVNQNIKNDDCNDDDDDVHKDSLVVENIECKTRSANVSNANHDAISDIDVVLAVEAHKEVDAMYKNKASDDFINHVDSLNEVCQSENVPLVKTHPKAILHASSDPPPKEQNRRTALLTVADNSSSFQSRPDGRYLTFSNPCMPDIFEKSWHSMDAAPLFILHTKSNYHRTRKKTKLHDTAISLCALAFASTTTPKRWDREQLDLTFEDAAGIEATILQCTKMENCDMDQLPQNLEIMFDCLPSGPQSLRLGVKQIFRGSLESSPTKYHTRSATHELLASLRLIFKLCGNIGAVMWCADTVHAITRVTFNKETEHNDERVLVLTSTASEVIMYLFENLSGCVGFIKSQFDSSETFQLLPVYKYTSSLHRPMRYFKPS